MTSERPVPLDVLGLVQRLFAGPAAKYGPFTIRSGATVLDDALYEFSVRSGDRLLTLSLFTGITGELAGQLWEQEVRVLLRVGRLRHRALPEIERGGYDPDEKAAWIAAPRPEVPLDASVTAHLNAHKGAAVRHLLELADALSVLHGQGIVHRNLWPGTVFVEVDRSIPEQPRLISMSLGRFETSAMLSNLARHAGVDPSGRADAARHLFLSQGDGPLDSLRYFAPERLDALLGLDSAELQDTDRADVFALGAIAWEWFFGPMPIEGIVTPGAVGVTLRDELTRLHEALRRRLRDPTIPRALTDVLGEMLRSDPRTRATSAEVAGTLTERYHALVSPFEDAPTTGLLLAFRPAHMIHSLHDRFHWARHEATSALGQREIRSLIEQDLSRAILTCSPSGAEGYLSGDEPEKLREGRYVLIGKRATWFCRPYRPLLEASAMSPGALGDPLPNVMLICHVGLNSTDAKLRELKTRALTDAGLHRRISSVAAVSNKSEDVIEDERAGRPKWTPLLASVERDEDTPADQDFTDALEFLLELQAAELMLREYPYERISGPYERHAVLRYDHDCALTSTRRNDLFALRVRDRPKFGEFFVSDAAIGRAGEVELRADQNGRPMPRPGTIGANVVKRDKGEIAVDRGDARAPVIPEHGWIRPADDRAADTGIRRQRTAFRELLDQRGLLGQLQEPASIVTAARRWQKAGAGLRGGADAVVQRMLGTEPFFAIHGPPGSGKTTVVSHAVEAYLREEPGARVLVSAQANDALDHLALQILKRLKRGGVSGATPLRIGRNEQRIHADMLRWRIEDLTQTVIGQAAGRTRSRLKSGRDAPEVGAVLEKWLATIEGSWVEIGERLERGANLVFATCSGANVQAVGAGGAFAAFDWVIIEEAAKAWPTELAVPLVRGVRWTLIGDHRQLPAFRSREVLQTLKDCQERATIPRLRRAGKRRDQYEATFRMFAEMFELDDAPVARLDTQFRMPKAIADAVSDAFYVAMGDPPLLTDRDGNGDTPALESLPNASLIWIDTANDDDCREEGRWSNPGEAAVIARLVKEERLLDGDHAAERTAILTPWHEQRRRLDGLLGTREGEFVHTVDSFQGQEAQIVICSLVRDKPSSSPFAHALLGHNSDPQRVNVMLSRAIRVNVIVGHLAHHETCGLPFWTTICWHVRQHGVVVDSGAVGRR